MAPDLDTGAGSLYPGACEDVVCATMKPNSKSRIRTTAKALVDDLNAVRAAVLDRQQTADAGERAMFETRLFESWVIDRLAQHECQLSMFCEELTDFREELEALRKSLQRPARKTGKEKKER